MALLEIPWPWVRSGFLRHHKVQTIPVLLAVAALMTESSIGAVPRSDPNSGRVRLLYMGDPIGQSPFPHMTNEPLLDTSGILACKMWYSYETIRRSMRVYMPRTLADLNASYDIVILSDANVRSFETKHLGWFTRSVKDFGFGLAMIGGFESFGGHGYSSWGDTTVGDILPVDCPLAYNAEGQIEIIVPANPVVSNLPWETIGPSNYFGGNVVIPKTGAELVANMRRGTTTYPLLVWWDVERGRSFAMAADWTPAAGTAFMKWAYYGDFCVNVVLFTAGQDVPEDVEIVHMVRGTLRQCMDASNYLYSMMDFAEKFGANTRNPEQTASHASELLEEARRRYLDHGFEDAHSTALEALQVLERGLEEALASRDRALTWIYIIEYLVVTATCMISGTILYTLMIRRRLYREIEVTRPERQRRLSR